jgi:hypothetical protein
MVQPPRAQWAGTWKTWKASLAVVGNTDSVGAKQLISFVMLHWTSAPMQARCHSSVQRHCFKPVLVSLASNVLLI